MVTWVLLNRNMVLMHICNYKRSICLKARLAHGVLGFPNTSDFIGSIHIKLQMFYKGKLFYKNLFSLEGTHSLLQVLQYALNFSAMLFLLLCFRFCIWVSNLAIRHSECTALCKVGFSPHIDLHPKQILWLIGLPSVSLSATLYGLSYIQGLSLAKGLLIEVADYRLWLITERRHSERSELSSSNIGWAT